MGAANALSDLLSDSLVRLDKNFKPNPGARPPSGQWMTAASSGRSSSTPT